MEQGSTRKAERVASPHPARDFSGAADQAIRRSWWVAGLLMWFGAGLWPGGVRAQSPDLPRYVDEVWTVEDGLPVNSVNTLVQTRDGYLWLATFDGLVRYDGLRFTVFNSGNTVGLPSNRIVDLLEARDGSLWMRTEQRHLVRFHEDRFTTYGPENGLGGRDALVLYEDADSLLWVGTDRGVSRFHEGRLEPFATEHVRGLVKSLCLSRTGALWVGTWREGLARISDAGATWFTTDDGLSTNEVHAIFEAGDGTLWIGAGQGLHTYHDGTLTRMPRGQIPALGQVHHIYAEAPRGTLWLGTDLGVYRYQDGEARPVGLEDQLYAFSRSVQVAPDSAVWFASGHVLYRAEEPVFEVPLDTHDDRLPPMPEIRAFLHDREGSIWIGTTSNGLYRLKPATFTVYSQPEGIPHRNVYTVYEDREGALWVGTYGGGLGRLDEDGVTTYQKTDGLPGSWVMSFAEDREGALWVGMYETGLCRLRNRACTPVGLEVGLPNAHVYALLTDRAGTLWVGTDRGLYRNRDGAWTHYTVADGLTHDYVRAIYEVDDGTLWMGTNGGGLMHYQDGRFTPFTAAHGLSSNLVRSIYQDAEGLLWIGTEGRGLNRIDLRGTDRIQEAAVTVYRQRDGLFDEVIHQILEDDFGRLWMSTNRGIFWVLREGLNAFAEGRTTRIHSTSYSERDGLRNREANGGVQPAGVKASDGRLWFPTQDGAAVVDPETIRRNEMPPPVVIEEVTAGNRVILPHRGNVALKAPERNFEIAYTALSFMAPENMRFRYRLEGFDDDWVEAGSRRMAFYTKVPPGQYTFRVIASNNDGVWNQEGATLALAVAPYFYESTWYRGLLLLLLLLLGIGGIRWRDRRLKVREQELEEIVAARTSDLTREKEATEQARREAERQSLLTEQALETVEAQAEQLKDLDEAKSRFFANISHEFRTPLTLTIGPLEDLRTGLHGPLPPDAIEEIDRVLHSARRLLRLVNQILDVAKLEAGQLELHAQRADLVRLLDGLALAFAPLAERKHIAFQADLPSEPAFLYIDPDLVEKIFANLLSNAFKFTPEQGAVRLEVARERAGVNGDDAAESVVVTVRDSGPGIPADKLHLIFERFYQADEVQQRLQPGTGIGLSLVRELVELHGGRIGVASEVGFGTTFTVAFRTGRDHLAPEQIVDAVPEKAYLVPEVVAHPRVPDGHTDTASVPAPPSGQVSDEQDVTTVLVVDDNPGIRAYVRKHLEPEFRVVEAVDGAEGLAVARQVLPDLILSDVMMPEMDGYALCRALKADPGLDFIPVILLTARATTRDKVEGLEEGADAYLTKPFDVEELTARVHNLIVARQRLREHFKRERVLHASEVEVVSTETAFLERVREEIEAHMADDAFSVEALSAEVGVSRGHLHRRLRELAGQTPTEAIRRIRLERAAQLLDGQAGSVSEVAYGVGFKSVSHFSQCFREAYGATPSEYAGGREAG